VDGRDPSPPHRSEVADSRDSATHVVRRNVTKIRHKTDVVQAHAGDSRFEQPEHARITDGEAVQDDTVDAAVATAAKVGIGLVINGCEDEQIAPASTQTRPDALEQSEKDLVRSVRIPDVRRHADHRGLDAFRSHPFGRERIGLFAKELSLSRLPFD
jgi:hypothetical protein